MGCISGARRENGDVGIADKKLRIAGKKAEIALIEKAAALRHESGSRSVHAINSYTHDSFLFIRRTNNSRLRCLFKGENLSLAITKNKKARQSAPVKRRDTVPGF